MFELIRANQLNIMLGLTSVCLLLVFLLIFTRALSVKRKYILIAVELMAALLLYFDRMAYLYAGGHGDVAYRMVRLSNFMVFFLTSAIVLGFNFYLSVVLREDVGIEKIPRRLVFSQIGAILGMLLIIFSSSKNWIYYIDVMNHYHRGTYFLLGYIAPVTCPLIQLTVILQYRKRLSPLIFTAMTLYIVVPVACGILQIYTYGISIVNMSMVLVSIFFYVFTYLDINHEIERMHRAELEELEKEKHVMKELFEQTTNSFINGMEQREDGRKGRAARVAVMAGRIAKLSGKSEEECDEVYYTALLHNIGLITLPDSLIQKHEDLKPEEKARIRQLPEISSEILSGIRTYPYLSEAARYCYESYDGSGYPEGLKGNEIPEIARIVAIAEAYDDLSTKRKDHDPLPMAFVREEFVKNAGTRFDPDFSDALVRLIDADTNAEIRTENESFELEKEISCGKYRSTVACGIPIGERYSTIRFHFAPSKKKAEEFSTPAIIIFDSYNRRVHKSAKSIETFGYYEYAELWFDGHSTATGVRNMEVNVSEGRDIDGYEIITGRYEDHVKITLISNECTVTAILAMPDRTRSAYIGLTGEHCVISGIEMQESDEPVRKEDIPRIADEVSFIDRIESDLPNLQVDRWRSVSTEGIPVKDGMKLIFHTRSLPTASLVWHCPYVILFYSEDKKLNGEGYREYAQVKLNGETDPEKEFAENHFVMKKREGFPGWRVWKEMNKDGVECTIEFARKGNRIIMTTENAGIYIENTTKLFDGAETVYVSLTGDQVALTDIRVRNP